MKRKLTFAGLALLCALVAGTSAEAAGKKRVVVDRWSGTYGFAIDCAEFGPYEFENVVGGRDRGRIVDVFAEDGTLIQTVFHLVFRETGTNSETGSGLPLHGAVHEVWDYAANTRTISGKVYLGTRPGAGTYLQDTGRITMDIDTREVSFEAGPHEGFHGGVDEAVCAALAGA